MKAGSLVTLRFIYLLNMINPVIERLEKELCGALKVTRITHGDEYWHDLGINSLDN